MAVITMKLPPHSRSRSEELALFETIALKMRNSPDLPPNDPALQGFLEAEQALVETTQQLNQIAIDHKKAIARSLQASVLVKAALDPCLARLSSLFQGDASKITALGLRPVEHKDRKRVVLPPEQVVSVVLTTTKTPGEVKVRCKRAARARVYELERAPSASGPFEVFERSTRCRMQLEQVGKGQVWLRVRAFGTMGHGPYSDPVMVDLGGLA